MRLSRTFDVHFSLALCMTGPLSFTEYEYCDIFCVKEFSVPKTYCFPYFHRSYARHLSQSSSSVEKETLITRIRGSASHSLRRLRLLFCGPFCPPSAASMVSFNLVYLPSSRASVSSSRIWLSILSLPMGNLQALLPPVQGSNVE